VSSISLFVEKKWRWESARWEVAE